MRFRLGLFVCALLASHCGAAELVFETEEIGAGLGVGYAVTLVDMNGDERLDVVVVDTARVIWYENPSWRLHPILEGGTKKDNVCIAPLDIDGDGRLDFALGADWRPFDTATGGTVQWLAHPTQNNAPFTLLPIGTEPMMHRMRWADIDGSGRPALVAVPLMGRDTKAPDWDTRGVRILAYRIPADPRKDSWPVEVLNEDLHVTHNFCLADVDDDGREEILVASFEGVTQLSRSSDGKWAARRLCAGNQQTRPNRGASEVKLGRFSTGKYIATIEPWHGHQVVVYTPPSQKETLWTRHVLDEQLKWGHAVWCADLDGDADEELVIGVRDKLDDQAQSGLRIYDPAGNDPLQWQRTLVDPGGVAIEDLAVADLDGDGRRDVVAVGRATHNVRIYWNKTERP